MPCESETRYVYTGVKKENDLGPVYNAWRWGTPVGNPGGVTNLSTKCLIFSRLCSPRLTGLRWGEFSPCKR